MTATAAPPKTIEPSEVELPYDWAILAIEDLVVDPIYQRALKPQQLKRIVTKFKPSLLGVVTVNRRKNDDLALIDGQHRVAALSEKAFSHVPAVVFDGLTRAQEAQLFIELQEERRNVTSVEKFKSRLAYDPQAKDMRRIAGETGWEIGNTGLRCIAELDKLYQRDAAGVILYRTLRTLQRAWPTADAKNSAHGSVVAGIGRFIAEQDPDDEKLIRQLGRTTPQDVLFRADNLRQGKGSGTANVFVTEVVTSLYTRRESAK